MLATQRDDLRIENQVSPCIGTLHNLEKVFDVCSAGPEYSAGWGVNQCSRECDGFAQTGWRIEDTGVSDNPEEFTQTRGWQRPGSKAAAHLCQSAKGGIVQISLAPMGVHKYIGVDGYHELSMTS
jgi:hypothetical protein